MLLKDLRKTVFRGEYVEIRIYTGIADRFDTLTIIRFEDVPDIYDDYTVYSITPMFVVKRRKIEPYLLICIAKQIRMRLLGRI